MTKVACVAGYQTHFYTILPCLPLINAHFKNKPTLQQNISMLVHPNCILIVILVQNYCCIRVYLQYIYSVSQI